MEISRHLLTENHTDKKDTEKMHNEFTEENPADIDFTQNRRKKQTADNWLSAFCSIFNLMRRLFLLKKCRL